jgi:hypothetical protein
MSTHSKRGREREREREREKSWVTDISAKGQVIQLTLPWKGGKKQIQTKEEDK